MADRRRSKKKKKQEVGESKDGWVLRPACLVPFWSHSYFSSRRPFLYYSLAWIKGKGAGVNYLSHLLDPRLQQLYLLHHHATTTTTTNKEIIRNKREKKEKEERKKKKRKKKKKQHKQRRV